MYIQTINEVNKIALLSQVGGQLKQPIGLGPKIIGGKIVDPRIYQDNGICCHSKTTNPVLIPFFIIAPFPCI